MVEERTSDSALTSSPEGELTVRLLSLISLVFAIYLTLTLRRHNHGIFRRFCRQGWAAPCNHGRSLLNRTHDDTQISHSNKQSSLSPPSSIDRLINQSINQSIATFCNPPYFRFSAKHSARRRTVPPPSVSTLSF